MKNGKITSFVGVLGNDGKIPSEIQVLPIGKWDTSQHGLVEVTEKDVEKMVANFDKKVRTGVPVDVDHDRGAAAGWVGKLINKGSDGLWAVVDWTTKGTQLLENRLYKLFSPEFSLNYEDPETREKLGPVLVAGTLTNRPLLKELKPIVAKESLTNSGSNMVLLFQEDKSMNLKEILAKELKDLNDEEKKFVADNSDKLSKEEKVKFEIKADEKPLDKVRTKEVSDLTDEDKTVLKANADSLSDEEKQKFSEVLEVKKDPTLFGKYQGPFDFFFYFHFD